MISESIENIYFYNLDCRNPEKQKQQTTVLLEVVVECVDDVNL